jgi:three-Cys-motif partner protein
MLSDDDLQKWEYAAHTRAKHRLLSRYVTAWLSILGQGARRYGHESRLVLVDAFAGRGRYAEGEPGSPLILREISGLVSDAGKVDIVELYFIENNRENFDALAAELTSHEIRAGSKRIVQHPPVFAPFEQTAPAIIAEIRRTQRSSFWFIDPFGFAGLPLSIIRSILALDRSEVFITYMVRDVNRFLGERNHQQAISRLLGLGGADLAQAISQVELSGSRVDALRDLYVDRLREGANAKYARSFAVAIRGVTDIVYFLLHASNDPKALREMKKAAFAVSGGTYSYRGVRDPVNTGQISMFDLDEPAFIDPVRLRRLLLDVFAERTVEYEDLQDQVHAREEFALYIDRHVHSALQELASVGRIKKIRPTGMSGQGLERGDKLEFPLA